MSGRENREVEDGQHERAEHVELGDRIVVAVKSEDGNGAVPIERDYEIVGIVEESDSPDQYAVAYNEPSDEFIVTDAAGQLLPDDRLAQDILNEYLAQSGDDEEEGR